MTTLQAHKLLSNANDTMNGWNTEATRAAVLELLANYNELAAATPSTYRQLKNAGTTQDVWLIAA